MAESTITQGKLNIEQVVYNGLIWVNIEKPTPRETEYLAQNYPFHPLDLDDCLSRIQRPKIDEYEDYLFIVLHFPLFSAEARVTIPSQVSIFISNDYIITLHAGDLKPLVKLFRECQLNEETCRDNMKSTGYLLYRIVDRLIDYCLPITNKIMANIEKVEDDIFDTTERGTVKEISILRRDIIAFRRIIWPMRAVISTLERKTKHITRREDMEVYWGDLIDHVDKIWDTLDECKEIIEGLKDTNDSLYSHQTTEVMRVLTIIATIMMPLTLVASIYGMNIPLPGEGRDISFLVILIVMIVVIGAMLYLFRRRRWI
ncbi:magnesium/cobalt transporter CorA [Chloroflexota bacterium]